MTGYRETVVSVPIGCTYYETVNLVMASCFVDDTGVAPESFSLSPLTGSSRCHLNFVLHFRSIDPGAMASTGTVCVCALIHRTIFGLIQLIFSCVLIITDNHQNNYFSHVR